MKVVVYKGQKKFTIDNVTIPDIQTLHPFLSQTEASEMTINDIKDCHFNIISTQGWLQEEEGITYGDEYDGINWSQETVN